MIPELQKNFGAFYTPQSVAEFLTSWAIRDSGDVVLDPSAGEGVFLMAARTRILELGGKVDRQVRGIELSQTTHDQTQSTLTAMKAKPYVIQGDFFDQTRSTFGSVTAVIGNPPFIRYQRFTGANRQKALKRALEAGVKLSELSSSWAPFLVHATTFIETGGRMAVVAPAELAHASYARPVVQFLAESFAEVKVLVFAKRLFPDLSEDTVLLLAEGRGLPFKELTLHQLDGADSLNPSTASFDSDAGQVPVGWAKGATRLVEYFLPAITRELYRELSSHPLVLPLGSVADVGIGYVTGNNEFFHISFEEAQQRRLPRRYLAKSLRNARDVHGLVFTGRDWQALSERGDRNLLLHIKSTDKRLTEGVKAYLTKGARVGVSKTYKCRTRAPWYSVPHVYTGDAFVSYMSGSRPKLFLNQAKAVAPNTLHVVRCRPQSTVPAPQLAAAWHSALTSLSCEIEGHGMGGGMLKLEPRESARLLIPVLRGAEDYLEGWDVLARQSHLEVVQTQVDRMTGRALGISQTDMTRLREAALLLRNRRTGK